MWSLFIVSKSVAIASRFICMGLSRSLLPQESFEWVYGRLGGVLAEEWKCLHKGTKDESHTCFFCNIRFASYTSRTISHLFRYITYSILYTIHFSWREVSRGCFKVIHLKKCSSEIPELAGVSLGGENGWNICDERYPVHHHSYMSVYSIPLLSSKPGDLS